MSGSVGIQSPLPAQSPGLSRIDWAARIVACLALASAVAASQFRIALPRGSFVALRWMVFAPMAFATWIEVRRGRLPQAWIVGLVGVLFNPLRPFYFSRQVWLAWDVFGSAAIVFSTVRGWRKVGFRMRAVLSGMPTRARAALRGIGTLLRVLGFCFGVSAFWMAVGLLVNRPNTPARTNRESVSAEITAAAASLEQKINESRDHLDEAWEAFHEPGDEDKREGPLIPGEYIRIRPQVRCEAISLLRATSDPKSPEDRANVERAIAIVGDCKPKPASR